MQPCFQDQGISLAETFAIRCNFVFGLVFTVISDLSLLSLCLQQKPKLKRHPRVSLMHLMTTAYLVLKFRLNTLQI